MTTKASLASTTRPSSSSGVTSTSSGIQIKKELPNDEIKDFAETAMNELLGWYGYDNMERLDLTTKSSKILMSTAAAAAAAAHNYHTKLNGSSKTSRSSHHGDSTTPDHDSSRENSKSPLSTKNSDKLETCGWCRRTVPENSPEFLTTPDGPRYCSEACFSQSRRASFKKAKQCDWCKHVRHAVSYVDFQDGASQLQFCSDKCLNQYKMQIFCKETQAHLDMNPHLKEKCSESSGSLITPELWLKNCKSRSASPAMSDISTSPPPNATIITAQSTLPGAQISPAQQHRPPSSPPSILSKPLITVAPASKLMSKNNNNQLGGLPCRPVGRRKRLHHRLINNNNNNNNNNINNNNNNNNNNNSNNNNSNNFINDNSHNSNQTKSKILNSLSSTISKSMVQDLSRRIPPIDSSASQIHHHPSYFAPPPSGSNHFPPPQQPQIPGIRPSFMNQHPRLLMPHHAHLPQTILQPDLNPLSQLLSTAPPITVMVPYPIVIPLPIPIPIPIPISNFLDIAKNNNQNKTEIKNETNLNSSNSDEPLDFTKSKTESPEIESQQSSENSRHEHDEETSDTPVVVQTIPPDNLEEDENNKKVPKFKITRLHTKRLSSTTPPSVISNQNPSSECSRPLRKRKYVCNSSNNNNKKDEDDLKSKKSS